MADIADLEKHRYLSLFMDLKALVVSAYVACCLKVTPQSWWRHQMETFSALLAICAGNSPVTSEFLTQRPVTRSFDVFFDLRLDKRLSKQWWGWWFEMPSRPLWRHCNDEGHGVSNHQHWLNLFFRAHQIKHQSSASLAFVRGIHRWPDDSPHREPVTRGMLPFDTSSYVITTLRIGHVARLLNYWGYYHSTLSCRQVFWTHMKIKHNRLLYPDEL